MADDQDQSQKTEEPTQRRLQEAFRKGQVAFSREVSNFFILLVLAFLVVWLLPLAMGYTMRYFQVFLESPESLPMGTADEARSILADSALHGAGILAILIGGTVVAAVLASFVQNGIVFSSEPIKPKLEKISPMKGIKRLFSMRSMIEFVKGIFKIIIIGSVGYLAVKADMEELAQLPVVSLESILLFMQDVAKRLMIGVCSVMALIALLDVLYQRYEYKKNLRMTKQEVKDEMKQHEGDPHIKARLRGIRMERARERMMAAVPQADVVVTNPTHFAVALKYDTEVMQAPVVIAKGQDHIAFRIRTLAEEHDIPIVENPPLARALFDSVEIEQEIPFEHYQAVAEVISYVYRLKGRPGSRR